MSYDTINFQYQIKELPYHFQNLKNESYKWGELVWQPATNKFNDIHSYYAYAGNLKLILKKDVIYIKNSLQKFFMNNNYQPFTYTQVVKAFEELNHLIPFNVYEAKVTKLAIGIAILEDAQKVYNEWQYYLGKQPMQMQDKNKIYGAKFHLNDYYIKGYDKTFQVKSNDKINIEKPYFRLEIEGKPKFFNNKTNNVGINTVADLVSKVKYQKLCDILISRYNMIEKKAQIDLSELTLKEKRLVASMTNFNIKESIRKQHSHSYKKERIKYLSLIRNADNTEFQNKVFNKLNNQIQYSLNN